MKESEILPVGIMTGVEGSVEIYRSGEEKAVAGAEKKKLYAGDTVNTGSEGKAEITMLDESLIRLAPNSNLLIDEYLLNGNKRKSGVIKLFKGKARAIITKTKDIKVSRFEVQTPTATVGVRGTDFFVTHKLELGLTDALVLHGTVEVFNNTIPDKVALLTDGKITSIDKSKPPSLARLATELERSESIKDTTIGYIVPVVEKKKKKKKTILTMVERKITKRKSIKKRRQAPGAPDGTPFISARIFKAKCSGCHSLGKESTKRAMSLRARDWSKSAMMSHVNSVLMDDKRDTLKEYGKLPMNASGYDD